ncbi:unnamed protein product [Effrenium voratum]|nr:unnamed protein product [Effrenium voratum]
MARGAILAASAGALLAQSGCLVSSFFAARAAWGWSASPSPPMSPMPTPMPSPPPSCTSTWSAWGACSVSCGQGSRTRTSNCSPFSQSEACNQGECCGQWSSWASCPVTCGGGTRSRSRAGQCTSSTESEACGQSACATCGTWTSWTSCSATCGAGTRSRSRSGQCSSFQDSESCNSGACPVATTAAPAAPTTGAAAAPSSCGVWQSWSACTASCGTASRMRSRGGSCQPFVESASCSLASCPAATTVTAQMTTPQPTTTTSPTTEVTTSVSSSNTVSQPAASQTSGSVIDLSRPTTAVVEVRVRMASDFSKAGSDIDGFKESFRAGVAEAGGISEDRVVVRSITKGSIIVDFIIAAAANAELLPASIAFKEFEDKLSDQTHVWPSSLQSIMAEGITVEASAAREMDTEELQSVMKQSANSATVFLTPVAGYSPPAGCACVHGEGITNGCAKHKGVSPPWCLVAYGCPSRLEGANGDWAWCQGEGETESSYGGGGVTGVTVLQSGATQHTVFVFIFIGLLGLI